MRKAGDVGYLTRRAAIALVGVMLVAPSCSSPKESAKKTAAHAARHHAKPEHLSSASTSTAPSSAHQGSTPPQNPGEGGAAPNADLSLSPATPNTFLSAQDFQSIQQAVQSFGTATRSTTSTNFQVLPAALSTLVGAVQELQNSINTKVSDPNYRSSLVDQANVLNESVTSGGELIPAGVANLTSDYQRYLACTSNNDPSFCADQSQNDINEILMGIDGMNRSISTLQSMNDSFQRSDQWWVSCTQTQPQRVCLSQVNPNG